jgi:hypothetical protein
VPFFRSLAAELTRNERVQVVFMSIAGLGEAERRYGRAIGISESKVFAAPEGVRRRIRLIPTLVVVDRQRLVRFVYTGSGSEERVDELSSRIGRELTLW